MAQPPMIEALTAYPSYEVSDLKFALSASYRTLVEILAYYDRMDGYAEVDRLGDVKEWMERALSRMFGEGEVAVWEQEAKSPAYSPFAL